MWINGNPSEFDNQNKKDKSKMKDTDSIQKVKAVTDDGGHWYVIPDELNDEFNKDLYNEEMSDSGLFDDKYHKYRTGGGLNNIQLWAELK